MRRKTIWARTLLLGLVLGIGGSHVISRAAESQTNASRRSASPAAADEVPIYEWDPTWPKPLPNNWVTGSTVGVAADAKDHIWIVHRPNSALTATQLECCAPAPSVIEFDQAGNLSQAWGGPSAEVWAKTGRPRAGAPVARMTWTPLPYPWVTTEHNILIDHKDNVWLGNAGGGSHILKLTRHGKLVLQIGQAGVKGRGSNDPTALASPTGIAVDPKANEVYVADGYENRRVIVFDSETGAYKRHWGAYGNKPDDSAPYTLAPAGTLPKQFNTVHCVAIDKDDLVWVCDRANSRIQVFRKDGTFVKEAFVSPPREGVAPVILSFRFSKGETAVPMGSVFDFAFSRDPEQRWGFVADGRNERIQIIRRSDMKVIGSFGHAGHGGGGFTLAHNLAVDSRNNVYVTESVNGNRAQRFLYKGVRRGGTN